MKKLPIEWCIKAYTEEEAVVILRYIRSLKEYEDISPWDISDCLRYFLHIDNGVYVGGLNCAGYIHIISFEEFERLILNKSNNPQSDEPQYEIY